MCVLSFSTNFSCKIITIKIINLDIIISVYRSSCKVQYRYSCQILIKLEFSREILEKFSKYKIPLKSVQWESRIEWNRIILGFEPFQARCT